MVRSDPAAPPSLRAASYNIWNIPVAPRTGQRMAALCARLRGNDGADGDRLDLLGLQEAFLRSEREALVAAAAEGGLRHSYFFRRGIGPPISDPTGLLLLSRWPIVDAAYWAFSLHGKAHKLQHFDWYCGKGMGLARVRADWGDVDVFLSHFVSVYSETVETDEYLSHRVAEALEAARWIELAQRAPLAVLLTDMNCPPESVPCRVLQALTGMRDALTLAEGGELPTFSYPGSPYAKEHPQRLDYVLWRTAPGAPAWGLVAAERAFVGEVGIVMSDHAAVVAELSPGSKDGGGVPSEDLGALLREAKALMEAGLRDAVQRRWNHLRHAALAALLALGCALWVSTPLMALCLAWGFVELFLSLVFCREEATNTRGALQELELRLAL